MVGKMSPIPGTNKDAVCPKADSRQIVNNSLDVPLKSQKYLQK